MQISDKRIAQECDDFTDIIFDLPGCYIVKAKYSRLVADLNRGPSDYGEGAPDYRKGVVINQFLDCTEIYSEPVSEAEIPAMIKQYHQYFHAEIKEYLPKVKFLIDGHSIFSKGKKGFIDAAEVRPDFCHWD